MLIKFNYQPDIKIKFQFRNYIRAVVNASVIGHVTPFLHKQRVLNVQKSFYVITLRRGRTRTREQLLLQNYKA